MRAAHLGKHNAEFCIFRKQRTQARKRGVFTHKALKQVLCFTRLGHRTVHLRTALGVVAIKSVGQHLLVVTACARGSWKRGKSTRFMKFTLNHKFPRIARPFSSLTVLCFLLLSSPPPLSSTPVCHTYTRLCILNSLPPRPDHRRILHTL